MYIIMLYLHFQCQYFCKTKLTRLLQLCDLAAEIKSAAYEDLAPPTILECLKALCTLLLDGKGIGNYQEDVQKKLARSWYVFVYL